MKEKLAKLLEKHRWIVLAAGVLVMIASGVPGAWGVYQQAVRDTYALSEQQTTMIFSFTIGAFGVFAILAGILQDKIGPRLTALGGGLLLGTGFIGAAFLPAKNPLLFYLTYSLLAGGGCASLYPTSMSCAQKWYADKKGFATGVIGCSVGLSGVFVTYYSRFFIQRFGVRTAFFVTGATFLLLILIGALFLQEPKKQQKAQRQGPPKNYTPLEVLRTRQYYLMLLAVVGSTAAVQLFTPIIVEMGTQRGLSEEIAVLSVVCSAAANAAGRLAMPWLSDKAGRRLTDLWLFAALAGLSIWFLFAQHIWVIVVFSLLTFAYSGQNALLPSIAVDLYGFQNSGANYGLITLGMSIGAVGFPLLAQLLPFENARHYLAVGGCCLGAVCIFMLKPLQTKKL